MGQAGCLFCGSLHRCERGECPVEQTPEGQEVCTITGLCLSMLNLSDLEVVESSGCFVTRQGLSDPCDRHGVLASPSWLEEQVYRVIYKILCSEAWATCRESESHRYAERSAGTMIRHLKNFKQQDKRHVPVIPDMIAQFHEEMGSIPHLFGDVPMLQRREMCNTCTRLVQQLIHVLGQTQPGLLQPQRIQGVATGLLYLLRTGVNCKGVCILPKLAQLGHMLPSEGNLAEFFDIRSKCITDCENLVKKLLRTQPSAMIQAMKR